jgi:hypothetical protein
MRLALVRGERDATERLAMPAGRHRLTFALPLAAATLDSLAALRKRALVEEHAPRHLQRGTYLEPFALRALGVVRGDEQRLARADERFRALGLDWHADQTPMLLRT